VHSALLSLGYDAVAIDVGRDLARVLTSERVQTAFIALHGRYGEDGCVQGLLELMGIPYTGSGVLASALAMNKLYAKQVFAAAGLLTTPFVALRCGDSIMPGDLPFKLPVVVKPVQEGSSVGVSIVKDEAAFAKALDEAFRYDRVILVEQYVKGQEVQVGILNDRPLGAIEIVPKMSSTILKQNIPMAWPSISFLPVFRRRSMQQCRSVALPPTAPWGATDTAGWIFW